MPTLPEPPVLFSMMSGCPSSLDTDSPVSRADTSAVPPGAKATRRRTGFSGHACERAAEGSAAHRRANALFAIERARERRVNAERAGDSLLDRKNVGRMSL